MPTKIRLSDDPRPIVRQLAQSKSFGVTGGQFYPRVDLLNECDDILFKAYGGSNIESLEELLCNSPTANAAIRLVADQWASLPIRELDIEGQEIEDPQYLDLITGGRQHTLKRDLAEPTVWQLYAYGRVFVEKVTRETLEGSIRAIRIRDTRDLKHVRFDADGRPAIYAFKVDAEFEGYNGQYATNEQPNYRRRNGLWLDEVPAENILEIKRYNPCRRGYGLPLAEGIKAELKLQRLITAWAAELADRRGRNLLFGTPSSATGDGVRKIFSGTEREQIEETLNSAMKEGRSRRLDAIIGTGAIDLSTHAISPENAELDALRTDVKRTIAAGLGVSPQLLGDIKSGTLTDAGRKQETADMIKGAVLPYLSIFLSEMSTFLFDADRNTFNDGRYFAVDTAQVEALQENEDSLHKRLRDDYLADGIRLNEFRVPAGYGEDESIQGDLYRSEREFDTQAMLQAPPIIEAQSILEESIYADTRPRNAAPA